MKTEKIDSNLFRYDRSTKKYVGRRPYYRGPDLEHIEFPWHYLWFSQFALYRWIIGGVWAPADETNQSSWVRLEDHRDDEFCHEHTEMEPCEYCARDDDEYSQISDWKVRDHATAKSGGFDPPKKLKIVYDDDDVNSIASNIAAIELVEVVADALSSSDSSSPSSDSGSWDGGGGSFDGGGATGDF